MKQPNQHTKNLIGYMSSDELARLVDRLAGCRNTYLREYIRSELDRRQSLMAKE